MSPERSSALADLLNADFSLLSENAARALIASVVDLASDAGDDDAIERALGLIAELEARGVSPANGARLEYYRANAFGARRRAGGRGWSWASELIDSELLALRRATSHHGFDGLHALERSQIHTNHGILLNHIGRFVEAIEAWNRAISLVPKMAMANGHRGVGLAWYSRYLYDQGHQVLFAAAARRSIEVALADDAIIESEGLEPSLEEFASYASYIDAQIDFEAVEKSIKGRRHSLGRSKREVAYRQWCLNERLFLNPLNDAYIDPIVAHDVMTLPTLVEVGLNREAPNPPVAIRQFNLLKQEYVTARYALHEAITSRSMHFSDRGVLLHDTLDFPAFGFAVERAKMAFRTAYALLDKCGYFLNDYLSLGHSKRAVSFRNVWLKSTKKDETDMHQFFVGSDNWPLRGLHWLSKDIYSANFKITNSPDALELSKLRNHLEHKFVTVHDDSMAGLAFSSRKSVDGLYDIDFSNLISRCMRQIKLARAALIYLSLGVYTEERRRESERDPGGLSMPMHLYPVRDSDKRRDWW